MQNILVPFLLTVIAGISTGIGGLIVIFAKDVNKKLFSTMLGFSAGVMIYISFMEMLQGSKITLMELLGKTNGYITCIVFFFVGILIIGIIDNLIPDYENPHEFKCDIEEGKNKCLYKIGIFSAIVIFIHNFPEGLLTFFSTIQELKLGIFMMIAILIHKSNLGKSD
ncbi:MAG: hypothetical protein A2Y24_07210 [Clostridiales bacterium GWE2_32_10]|nr:MAG: hypothetical protein A2Y24_07210 [Clostridiales bacterium GWE2_32_10]